jgi:predicted nucleotidyltransferase
MTLEQLTDQLQRAYGTNLRAVVLYGSAVAGEHIPDRSDYNVLVIADALPLSTLRAASATARAWKEAGHPAPLTFTSQEWHSSSDVFPMEYADILERHRVLFGEPPFDGISVSRADLRLQVEQQTMGKLLHLRKESMAAGGDHKRQLALMSASLSTMMILFRGVARLAGEVPSQDYAQLTQSVATRSGFDAEPVLRVVAHARGTKKIARGEAEGVLSGYIATLEKLSRYLDEFGR